MCVVGGGGGGGGVVVVVVGRLATRIVRLTMRIFSLTS